MRQQRHWQGEHLNMIQMRSVIIMEKGIAAATTKRRIDAVITEEDTAVVNTNKWTERKVLK